MATIEKSANFSGKNWGGYCKLTYTAGNGTITISGMAFKATNSTSASYGAYYDNNQTIIITAGSQSKNKQIAKVKVNSTSYQAATDAYSSSSFTAVSFNGLSGSTTVSFTVRARSSSPYNLTFSFPIDAGSAVVVPTVSNLVVTPTSETTMSAYFTINSNGGATATGHITCNGQTVNSTSATFTGLTAGQTYTITAYASNSAGNSTILSASATTYAYPTVTLAPNFIIGDSNVNIVLSNPLSRANVSIAIKYGNTTIRTLTTSSNSAVYNSSLDNETLYQLIPNNPSGTYTATATYSGVTTASKSGTFSVDTINDAPNFNLFEWEDVNPATLALTGNSNIVILNYSDIMATISNANKAIAQNYSTMQKYSFECGNVSPVDIIYSDDSDVSGTINKVPNATFKVTAIDSRNLSQKVTLSANNIINYTNLIKGESSIYRVGNVSEQITLEFEGDIWMGSFGQQNNAITNVTYQYKTADDATYTPGTTVITPTVDQDGHFTFTGLIKGDTNDGFDESNVYTIQVTVYDHLSSATYTFTLPSGKPHLAWYKDGLSIMGEYDENRNDALQVYGDEYVDGTIEANELSSETMSSPTNSLLMDSIVQFSANQWFDNLGAKVLDMNNSDIIGANNIYFKDESSGTEGLNFLKQNAAGTSASDYETLRGYRGNLYYNEKVMAPRSTSGNGYLRIPTSDSGGIQICWGSVQKTISNWSQDSTTWVSNGQTFSDFAVSFSSTPTVTKSIQNVAQSARYIWINGNSSPSTTNPGTFNLATYWNATNTTITASYIAIGTYAN